MFCRVGVKSAFVGFVHSPHPIFISYIVISCLAARVRPVWRPRPGPRCAVSFDKVDTGLEVLGDAEVVERDRRQDGIRVGQLRRQRGGQDQGVELGRGALGFGVKPAVTASLQASAGSDGCPGGGGRPAPRGGRRTIRLPARRPARRWPRCRAGCRRPAGAGSSVCLRVSCRAPRMVPGV